VQTAEMTRQGPIFGQRKSNNSAFQLQVFCPVGKNPPIAERYFVVGGGHIKFLPNLPSQKAFYIQILIHIYLRSSSSKNQLTFLSLITPQYPKL
jgi:hypothetical protein